MPTLLSFQDIIQSYLIQPTGPVNVIYISLFQCGSPFSKNILIGLCRILSGLVVFSDDPNINIIFLRTIVYIFLLSLQNPI